MKPAAGVLPLAWGLALMASLPAAAAEAETLPNALAAAYRDNAVIRAAEAQVEATAESYTQAVAGRLPSLTLSDDVGLLEDATESSNPFGAPSDSVVHYRLNQWRVNLTQILYRGGAISAGIDKTRTDTRAEGAALTQTTQSVLLHAVSAYLDVVLARDTVKVTRHNLQSLSLQKEQVSLALTRQDATVVDLDQVVSRRQSARAQYRQALGSLADARASYRRWIGHEPSGTRPPSPPPNLPASRDEALRLAGADNPAVIQAELAAQSDEASVDVADAQVLPVVALVAHYGRELDTLGAYRGLQTDYGVILKVSIPLYQGGAPAAQASAARESLRQGRLQVVQTRLETRQAAATAWDALVSSRANLRSRVVQADAARVALDGLIREQRKGRRSVLDVLNGRQELLDAQLAESQARHDLVLAEFRLLAAVGRLTPQGLDLPVAVFDTGAEVKRAGARWYDPGVLVRLPALLAH